MHTDYADIRSRIQEPPKWFDENATPRYCDFAPNECADIYADQAVLAEIGCQDCGHSFHVAFTCGSMDRIMNPGSKNLEDKIRSKELHYGDPPNVDCCAAGPTMNSEPRVVLEFWRRHHKEYVSADGRIADVAYFDWRRDASLEVAIDPAWVHAGGATLDAQETP